MRTIATEEHFVSEAARSAWEQHDPVAADASRARAAAGDLGRRLAEVGEERIAWMDAAGLDVQVLSLTSPGLHSLPAAQAIALQTETNDLIAAHVARYPERLQGFATLAAPAPQAAAAELERAVRTLGLQGALIFGRTGERNLDASENWVIFSRRPRRSARRSTSIPRHRSRPSAKRSTQALATSSAGHFPRTASGGTTSQESNSCASAWPEC